MGTPHSLLKKFKDYVVEHQIKGITVHQFFPCGSLPILEPECKDFIRINSLYASMNFWIMLNFPFKPKLAVMP